MSKVSKAQAEYRAHPHGTEHCSRCTMFEAPNACNTVEGHISPAGWCKYFKRRNALIYTGSHAAGRP